MIPPPGGMHRGDRAWSLIVAAALPRVRRAMTAPSKGHALLGASRCFPAMLMRVSARDLLGIRRPHG